MSNELERINATVEGEVWHENQNQIVIGFPNGYGASVVNNGYGRDSGLYEVAVVRLGPEGVGYDITYDTEITDDVLGWQTEADVVDVLNRVAALPSDRG